MQATLSYTLLPTLSHPLFCGIWYIDNKRIQGNQKLYPKRYGVCEGLGAGCMKNQLGHF